MMYRILSWVGMTLLLAACQAQERQTLPGYVTADFVDVAVPVSGRLEQLWVRKGDEVAKGALLFALDPSPERERRAQIAAELQAAVAELQDAKKGKRPSEIRALEAALQEAEASFKLSEARLKRSQVLLKQNFLSQQDYDAVLAERDAARARVSRLRSELETAKLGARSDRIAALEKRVEALQKAYDQAEWFLHQKKGVAPEAGRIEDIFFDEGEWIAPGRPVVRLLPQKAIKIRFFLPEAEMTRLSVGDQVSIRADGLQDSVPAKVNFIAAEAEYTPPVIYSEESRGKLVFMVEAVPESTDGLQPGLPVDVSLP